MVFFGILLHKSDKILMVTDDELYRFFYPDKFKPKSSYALVDYAYVHRELSKVGVTEVLLWESTLRKTGMRD